jgi:hypothetical protein
MTVIFSIIETDNDRAALTISMIHVWELAFGVIDLVLIWRERLNDIFAFQTLTFSFTAISVYGCVYPIHRRKVTFMEDVCQSYAGDAKQQNGLNAN